MKSREDYDYSQPIVYDEDGNIYSNPEDQIGLKSRIYELSIFFFENKFDGFDTSLLKDKQKIKYFNKLTEEINFLLEYFENSEKLLKLMKKTFIEQLTDHDAIVQRGKISIIQSDISALDFCIKLKEKIKCKNN